MRTPVYIDMPSDRKVALLDPKSIESSTWVRPDPLDFLSPRFVRLKDSIAEFGGNLQPVKVRRYPDPLAIYNTEVANVPEGYELVFGHSRVRACLELGLPVLAMIERVSDVEAIRQFIVEYRSSERWRPWLLARTLVEVLDSGYFPTIRRASQELGLDVSEAALLQQIGRIPEEIRLAFGNVDITPRQAKKLVAALSADAERLTANARRHGFRDCATASAVMARLSGATE